ncbi:phospholipase B1 [Capsaspora owczarzaki ATCC 30864]|nr:phospholipase B1 [Capsaspora owczarzaki ATCC 30864]|eukprot:XP_004349482.1 phospholipase B1 [Capsaspora owczarzaki ATCC 30864]
MQRAILLALIVAAVAVSTASAAALPMLTAEQLQLFTAPFFSTRKPTGGLDMPCDTAGGVSETVPTSVHMLRPGDIKVVAALGDSLTAAYAAMDPSIDGMLYEYRNISWSVGGGGSLAEQITLPNILKEYNPDVTGFSTSVNTLFQIPPTAGLNVAVSGAIATGLPAQARSLVNKTKSDPTIDWEKDWKVVTLFIGGNDACALCLNETLHSPQFIRDNIEAALDILLEGLPRTLVNLVELLDVTQLFEVHDDMCDALHQQLCPCLGGVNDTTIRANISATIVEYQRAVAELAQLPKYNSHENFTVVDQPFFSKTKIPLLADNVTPDRSYFAVDCFHFASIAHEASGLALWNSMVEPVGHKRTDWKIGEPLECPSDAHNRPFFFTNYNSYLYLKYGSQFGPGSDSDDHAVAIGVGVSVGVVALLVVIVLFVRWYNRRHSYQRL